ncbi:hypothetical protein JCM17380_08110 [Desulfosporosinus burensis]
MSKLKILFFIVLLSLIVTGCSTTEANQTRKKLNLLDSTIRTHLSKEHSTLKVSQLKIISMIETPEGDLIQILFEGNGDEYIGFLQISKNIDFSEVVFSNIRPSNKNTPFDVHFMTSFMKKLNEEIPYIFLGGVINDKNIKEMQIIFDDTAIIYLVFYEHQETYNYARIGSNAGVKQIIAKDNEGKGLFSYPPYLNMQVGEGF